MGFFNSILYNMKEARYNPVTLTHGLLYIATVSYLRVLKNALKFDIPWFRNHVTETYHSKVLRLQDAEKIITINQEVELRNLEHVIPYKHAKDIILKNPQNIVAYECACRAQKKGACKPTDVCLVVGEPFADLLRAFQPFRSRRISPDEALAILKEEDARGHVHTAWFKTAMLDRFYAICNCCKCCCLGMKVMKDYQMKSILPSGYLAKTGDKCVGCGECARYCQFDAIETISYLEDGKEKKRYQVNPEKCFGCGICESKCKKENITLVLAPEKGIPLDVLELAKASRQEPRVSN